MLDRHAPQKKRREVWATSGTQEDEGEDEDESDVVKRERKMAYYGSCEGLRTSGAVAVSVD
jgi:hypothetical protein